jgi:hypothetical protein
MVLAIKIDFEHCLGMPSLDLHRTAYEFFSPNRRKEDTSKSTSIPSSSSGG